MNERLPYEEQLDQAWDTLSLPDEDMAWKDMKRRLDEEDDDKIVVPPPRRGCGIGALLIGLLMVGIWFIVRPEKWFNKKETTPPQQTEIKNSEPDSLSKINKEKTGEVSEQNENKDAKERTKNDTETITGSSNSENTSLQTETNTESGVGIKTAGGGVKKVKNDKAGPNTSKKGQKPIVTKTQTENDTKNDNIDRKQDQQVQKNNEGDKIKPDSTGKAKDQNIQQLQPSSDKMNDTTQIIQTSDSITKNPVDSTVNKENNKRETKVPQQKQKEPRPIFFSAGIGLHQQIPIAGQEWATYGSLGRKGILSDYIPSVNFRMEKQDRWFVQGEFRYGAPQHTKQITYTQKLSIDTFTQAVITNSSSLRKTFYHQVPITFNYYIVKNWSVGAGFQWNKFFSAVSEQAVARRNPGTTTDSILSKTIVKVSNDSATALVKSWWQGIVQTQYQWKRLSIGARYSFGLQPYIRFTLPNQPLQEEKNNSFQIFLRYELWRSKNK